jgi:uncharacterized protein YaaQ
MKLVFAIVNDEDGHRVMKELNVNGFSVTKLCSTGGFLKSGNTTLLVGVDKQKVDQVIEIIKNRSKSRKQVINPPIAPIGMGSVYMGNPIEVVVGGATIFVIDVERHEKI